MTTPMFAPSVPWGDRTNLLPKSMLYAFSVELTAVANGRFLIVQKAATTKGIRHLFDDTVVTMPEGLVCDIPSGTIEAK